MSLRVLLSYKNYRKLTLQYFYKYTLLTDLLKLRKHVKSVLSGRQVIPYINNSCTNKTLSSSAIASLLIIIITVIIVAPL